MPTDDAGPPRWRTGVLWGLLAVLLVVGTLGAATAVYGLLGLLNGTYWDAAVLAVGGFVALLGFLFTAGILYRVDRYRGAAVRRVTLFE